MSEQNQGPGGPISRRRFLRNLAVAGGSAAVPLGVSSVAQAFTLGAPSAFTLGAPSHLRVGLAMPAFGKDGAQTASLVQGLRLALAGAPDVTFADAAPGTAMEQVAALGRAGADLVIGAVTPHGARHVGAALRGSRTVFLNVEPGAQILRPRDYHAWVFHHTLNLWQANYAAGVQAASARGRRAAILSSYIESGYDTSAAFTAGFESSGGTVVGLAVSHVPGQTATLPQLVSELHAAGADFIYVNASGERAAELLAAVGPNAVAAPFAQSGLADTPFANAYLKVAGAAPDAYALLGYEAGNLVLAAASSAQTRGSSLAAALREARFTGPRGSIHMQAGSHATCAGRYVDAGGAALKHLPEIAEAQALAHVGWPLAVSGWTLPYGASFKIRRA